MAPAQPPGGGARPAGGAAAHATPPARRVPGRQPPLAFDLPLDPEGTDFQRRVWRALLDIPYGETRSYADLARAVGSPRAMRAVGQANRRNPIGVVVPCHRVIAADGTIGGYAGGLDRKRHLLRLEGVSVD